MSILYDDDPKDEQVLLFSESEMLLSVLLRRTYRIIKTLDWWLKLVLFIYVYVICINLILSNNVFSKYKITSMILEKELREYSCLYSNVELPVASLASVKVSLTLSGKLWTNTYTDKQWCWVAPATRNIWTFERNQILVPIHFVTCSLHRNPKKQTLKVTSTWVTYTVVWS
jgi:hypothetical protein